jgi:glycine cleavage system aminomethyltransferase T
MNRTQAAVWHLLNKATEMPVDSPYTDVTESTVFLAIAGREVFSIAEKLSALDFADPQKRPPFLFQGPFSHVPCQVVTLSRDGDNSGILFTCSRGYAHDMVHAVSAAGAEFNLRPAGEDRFRQWVSELVK